ncbi:MAG: VWA domain-containing protein [Pseudomonadota bacterium]|nr:VWA domain-containing protein [Pseudomonadota bacterium]
MLIDFFYSLRAAELPVSVTEYLSLLEALEKRVVSTSVDDFYFLARTCLVKDEKDYDKFDRAFGSYFKGVDDATSLLTEAVSKGHIPPEWLARRKELNLTPEEMAMVESMGGWEKLMEALRERLENQQERHEGGNKNIGTAGRSPFGAHGFNPEGIRIGQGGGRQRSAVKVWDRREFRNYDDSVELGTRNIKVALKRLRRFVREGTELELDLDDTIRSTAHNAGYLDIKMVPERHNKVKVLLFMDVGGSMDDHVRLAEELFSAARGELKHLEYFYFHNFIYEWIWKDNFRRRANRLFLPDVLHTFGRDYKVIFVGDATMSPYEVVYEGGSIEHHNAEAGAVWMQRIRRHFDRLIWLNPEPESRWESTPSIKIIRELMEGEMYPLTIDGLSQGFRALSA